MKRNSDAVSYSLGEILAGWAENCPDREAFSFLARGEAVSSRLTYLALHRQALAIMRGLEGVRLAGRPVILIYPPGLDYIASFCGCLYAGVIAVPAPYLLPKRAGQRIAAICRSAEPAAVLTLSTLADLGEIRDAAPDLASLPWIATDTLDLQDDDPRAPLPMAPNHPAFLQFTSGSTGTPKGVIVSHGNLMANMAMIRDNLGFAAPLHGLDAALLSG